MRGMTWLLRYLATDGKQRHGTGSEAALEPSSPDPQAPHSPPRNYVLKIRQLP